MQLENEGSLHDKDNHWEKTILFGDIMTAGSFGENRTFTNFTIAVLQDTGWYKINGTGNSV